ncbi:hypothetical protein MMC09_004287 [Bachmanniomyces sp. S44760]|nr:hypothetical protein [Bachmanniomyces sp. S44760]
MAAIDAQKYGRSIAIALTPHTASLTDFGGIAGSPQSTKPYTCQTCARRKVKCDKATPICSSCRRGKLECFYEAPPPRRRKRNFDDNVGKRLAQYELILQQHGLLPQDADTPIIIDETSHDPISLRFNEPEISRTGKLLGGQGRSRYINSNLWYDLGDDEVQHMSDNEEDTQVGIGVAVDFASDPLTGAFLGSPQSLFQYHPTHLEAMMLWKTHIENVEPICKILHIPSTYKMVENVSQQPAMASKADECLLFAIYHFAVFSMTDNECANSFGESRATLVQRYHYAIRQALVNASFLKTTNMAILQALVLFLLSCRYFYDPHTYWILTGVAIRIAQRMGLHRDGEKLGLLPFDVQMRRRLFYQLIPLDLIASQMSGTGIGIMPDTWDTQQPSNINDDQIWPQMTKVPEEQRGATEMIFCLARSCLGKVFARAGKSMHGAGSGQFKNYNEVEPVIMDVENEVEEKFIRYCDIVNPLHFLTTISARSAITAMRLRVRLPKVRNQTITELERRELLQLSQKIIDTDIAAYAHPNLRKYYQWHMTSFFVWGSWDSLIFILTSLSNPDLLSSAESGAAWNRVEQVYSNHDELLESKRALHIAVGRLTLKAWDATPASSNVPEPAFVTALRSLRKGNIESRSERQDSRATTLVGDTEAVSSIGATPESNANLPYGNLSDGIDLDMCSDLNIDNADWMFWDQLIKDNQAQGDR